MGSNPTPSSEKEKMQIKLEGSQPITITIDDPNTGRRYIFTGQGILQIGYPATEFLPVPLRGGDLTLTILSEVLAQNLTLDKNRE